MRTIHVGWLWLLVVCQLVAQQNGRSVALLFQVAG